jgi:hypothetical protein
MRGVQVFVLPGSCFQAPNFFRVVFCAPKVTESCGVPLTAPLNLGRAALCRVCACRRLWLRPENASKPSAALTPRSDSSLACPCAQSPAASRLLSNFPLYVSSSLRFRAFLFLSDSFIVLPPPWRFLLSFLDLSPCCKVGSATLQLLTPSWPLQAVLPHCNR